MGALVFIVEVFHFTQPSHAEMQFSKENHQAILNHKV